MHALESDMNDLLVCLGQETAKVQALTPYAEKLGQDVESLFRASIEADPIEGTGETVDHETINAGLEEELVDLDLLGHATFSQEESTGQLGLGERETEASEDEKKTVIVENDRALEDLASWPADDGWNQEEIDEEHEKEEEEEEEEEEESDEDSEERKPQKKLC